MHLYISSHMIRTPESFETDESDPRTIIDLNNDRRYIGYKRSTK